jgi:hypothetical protein
LSTPKIEADDSVAGPVQLHEQRQGVVAGGLDANLLSCSGHESSHGLSESALVNGLRCSAGLIDA